MRSSFLTGLAVLGASFVFSGCASSGGGHEGHAGQEGKGRMAECASCPWNSITEAVAAVQPTKGNHCRGTVRFSAAEGGVRVVADLAGLSPNAQHAFHIHEFGDLTSGDGKSAGGHYNPGGHPHAGPDADMRHAGDLGNVQTDAHGNAHYDRVIAGVSVACGEHPIVGRSVVLHAKADDLTSQPAGAAGDRIAWGVIGVAAPAAAAK